MAEECPNCGKLTNTTHARLVKDSCGHTKCRLCLLYEEHGCKSCESEKHFQQIGNFDYPTRESTNTNNIEALNSETSNINIDTEPIKLEVNRLTNKYEVFACDDFSEHSEESNLADNTATIPSMIEKNNEDNDWALKIVEDEDGSSSNNVPIDVQDSEKDKKTEGVDNEKQKTPKYKRKTLDRSHISILPGLPEKYKCNVCGKTFRSKKGMCYHDSCVTGIRPYQCTLCDKSFVKRSDFEYHESNHSGYRPFKCTFCDKTFPQNNKLNRDMLSHSHHPTRESVNANDTEALSSEPSNSKDGKLTNKYEFLACGVTSEDAEEANLSGNTDIISCINEIDDEENDCTLKFVEDENESNSNNVSIVVQNSEKDEKTEGVDSEKEKAPKSKRKTLDRSHISILPGLPEKYKCNVCGKTFRSKKGMCYHDSCVTGVRPYQCTLCNRSFVKRSHFEYHERTHSGYRPFKCTLCDKAFPQNNKLNRHMFSHSLLKPFSCTKCGKSYCKKDDLKSHMNVHFGLTPFCCKTCGKAFRNLTNLKRHGLTHSSERPHVCEQCNKSFKDKALLKRHKRIHEKERPFSCAHCTRLFLSKCELRRHLATHSSEKPFSCEFCRTDFRRKDNLNRHIRHHHSEGSNVDTLKKPSVQSNNERKSSKTKRAPVKQKPKKALKSSSSSSVSKNSNKGSMVHTNSQNQINSRLDPMGNITPVIRTTGELSNAVPVINGPISIKKLVETPESRKKTFTYIEPIPLEEAVVINKRIEEKLYPQNTSNNYFFHNYSTSRTSISNNCKNYKNDYGKLSNQSERNCVKLKMKEITIGNESDVRNLSARLDRGNLSLEQRSNFSQVQNKSSSEMRNYPSKNVISCKANGSNSKLVNDQSNYVSTIKKNIIHSGNSIESNSCDESLEVEGSQKTNSTYWRRRTAEKHEPIPK